MKNKWWIVGLALALLVAVLSPLASSHPDGLERVAEDQGFGGAALDPWYEVIPDYVFPGVADERLATILAGVVGVVVLFVVMWGVGRLMARRQSAS
ncbi:MAG: PDGLE domain-containing protein [Anaerolineae bacterium]